MKNIFTTFILSACLFSAITATAQSSENSNGDQWFKKHDFAGAMQLQVGYRKTDLGQLNQILNNNGIPSLGNNNIWLNASMAHVFKKLIIEDGIGFTPRTSSEINGLKARYNQYQAFLRFGYNVSGNDNFRLYPFAGVNFNLGNLNIKDEARTEAVSDFSQQLLNSTRSKNFYQPNIGIDLGAGFDYLIKVKSKQMDNVEIERNIPIGIRAGYYLNVHQGDWKVDDFSLQNAPDNKNSAFFVTLNIGLGYHIKKK